VVIGFDRDHVAVVTERPVRCPIKPGDLVIYKTSHRGLVDDAMSLPEHRLISGKVYKVEKIKNGNYVVVKGYSHPGSGLYWTEFELLSG